MHRLWVFVFLAVAAAVAACSSPAQPIQAPTTSVRGAEGLTGRVTVAGSTTVQPLAEKLAEAFMAEHPRVKIDVQGGGSSVGVKSAGRGMVDVGTVSREIEDSEKQEYPDLKVFRIALDGIAIITNSGVSVDGLSKEQVRDIFAGKITNWRQVGGADRAIVVVAREEGSGTRAAFEEMVMGPDNPITGGAVLQPSNGAVRTAVMGTPDSIGFLSFGYLDQSVKALKVDGVEPTGASAASGRYPIVRPLNMLTRGEPTGTVKSWLDWILGPEGQQLVVKEGYIAVK